MIVIPEGHGTCASENERLSGFRVAIYPLIGGQIATSHTQGTPSAKTAPRNDRLVSLRQLIVIASENDAFRFRVAIYPLISL